jgi:hypothetical protein
MDTFIRLTSRLTNPTVNEQDKLKEICNATASLIKGADRVSLWIFSPDFESIKSIISYDSITRSYTSGQILNKSDFRSYFEGILDKEVINAPQARTHDITKCFNETYFEPLNIYSLLDFILHREFVPQCIICCESVGEVMQWSDRDIDSLKRIARAGSMYFKYNGSS